MSTKTTYKRIALVAVAALGFGLLSVAPSTAVTQSDTLAISATGNATSVSFGSTASTTLTQTFLGVAQDTMTVTVSLISGPSGNTIVPTLTANATTGANGTPTASGLVGTMIDTTTSSATFALASGQWTLALPGNSTMLAGTYVIRVTPANVTGAPILATVASAITWTVTVGAQATAAAVDTTSYAVLDEGTAVSAGSTDAVVVLPVSSGSVVATIRVYARTSGLVASGSVTLVTVLTGPGSVKVGTVVTLPANTDGARSVTTTKSGAPSPTTDPSFWVYVYSDGSSGTSSIALTIGGTTITKTVKFYGAAASVTSTLVTPVIVASGSTVSAGVITAVAKDASGNAVPGAKLWVLSSAPTVIASGTASVATVGSTGTASFDLVGLTAGTTLITIQNVAAGSTATFSAPAVSVRVGSKVGASFTMTLDKSTYDQGAAATLTVTIKDADGNLVADGSNSPFSVAPASSKTLTGAALPGSAIVTTGSNNGTLTYAINVPTTSGAFTISATAGSGWTGTFSATATVNPSAAETATAAAIAAAAEIAAAAVDAAAEATDAANAATDAANAAAEAADAATAAAQDASDAVSALSVQVSELVAGLSAQITAQKSAIRALTNLIIKIQKSLAKIKKKVRA